jgi:hypothetical protein
MYLGAAATNSITWRLAWLRHQATRLRSTLGTSRPRPSTYYDWQSGPRSVCHVE